MLSASGTFTFDEKHREVFQIKGFAATRRPEPFALSLTACSSFVRDSRANSVILGESKGVNPMGSNSYLQESELVILVLILTFVGTILYAKRAAKKRNNQNEK